MVGEGRGCPVPALWRAAKRGATTLLQKRGMGIMGAFIAVFLPVGTGVSPVMGRVGESVGSGYTLYGSAA